MRQRSRFLAIFAFALCAAIAWLSAAPPVAPAQESAAAKLSARIFEMRTYHTAPGRLDALHSRFRNHTNYLFVKHGMTLVGYWTPVDQPDTLVYILAYPSRDAREASWKAFMNDPVWKQVYTESHQDGAIVSKVESVFLDPTDYSPIR